MVVGANRTAAAIIAGVPGGWPLTVVDTDEEALVRVAPEGRPITRVRGDATSRLVLAKAGVDRRTVVVITTDDDPFNREVALVARREFGVEELVCLLDDRQEDEGLSGAEVVLRHRATAGMVLNAAGIGATRAIAIGLGRGELIQVAVLQGSAATGRPLREIGASNWLVAAVYRGDALLVPHGDTTVQAGDRVILVGEPEVLRDVGAFFHGGDPVFPNQYGARFGVAGSAGALAEAEWLMARTRAEGIVRFLPAEVSEIGGPGALAAMLRERDVGCLVVDPRAIPWYERLGVTRSRWQALLAGAGRPVLVARGRAPYRRVLVAIGAPEGASRVSAVALDVARQAGAALTALAVQPPALGGGGESAMLPRPLAEASRLHGIDVAWIVEEGNPIERIRARAAEHDLVVAGVSDVARHTLLTPDVSLFLLHDLPCSVLFVPWRVQAR